MDWNILYTIYMSDLISKVSREFNKLLIKKMNSFDTGKKFFRFLAKPYIAGTNIEEGIKTIQEFKDKKGAVSTFDILGEEATTLKKANQYMKAYKDIIDLLYKKFPDSDVASISLKLTSICAVDAKDKTKLLTGDLFNTRLEEIVVYAKNKGIKVTLDMEDHNWTDRSLKSAEYIWKNGHDNFGIVLQSRLNRTRQDIKSFLDVYYPVPREKRRVRACIGIYDEPAEIATTSKKEAKKRLTEMIRELFGIGIYVEIATHDYNVINEIIKFIKENKIDSSRFEFQFLKGVEKGHKIAQHLIEIGYKVRFYMPCELVKGDGTPYMERRLIANPTIGWYGLKNTFQRMLKY